VEKVHFVFEVKKSRGTGRFNVTDMQDYYNLLVY